jgi:hypothetical protein
VDRSCKTGVKSAWCGGAEGRSSTLVSRTSHLSDDSSREMRLEVHDGRRQSGLSRIADSHACDGAWTSRNGKACGDEVCVGRTAWIARHQRSVIGSHDVFIVLFVVALIIRDMAELTGSPLDVVVCVVVCAGSVGCRESAVSWVEVVIVFGEHGIGFYGSELGNVNAIRTNWLEEVDTIDLVVSQKHEGIVESKTHP